MASAGGCSIHRLHCNSLISKTFLSGEALLDHAKKISNTLMTDQVDSILGLGHTEKGVNPSIYLLSNAPLPMLAQSLEQGGVSVCVGFHMVA